MTETRGISIRVAKGFLICIRFDSQLANFGSIVKWLLCILKLCLV